MGKQYKIINQQMEKLKQKGLIFKDEEMAKQILLKENYYFLTSEYEEVFLDLKKASGSYEEETYFEELYAIYNFDRELKNLVLDYIGLVETKLKSFIAYEYIERYGEVDLFQKGNLSRDFQAVLKLDKLKSQVDENRENMAKNNRDVQKCLKQDGYLKPLMAVKYFTFGNIVAFFGVMKPEDQAKVAEHFGQIAYNLEKQYRMLNIARNICAHGGVLFNYQYEKNDLFSIMKVMKKLLDRENFYNMFIRVENLLIYVRNQIDSLSYQTLLKMMGFPEDYKSLYYFEKGEKKMGNYEPKPVDTKDVVLSDEIMELAERLAKNTHDIWAVGRLNEGWKYGTVRDDKLKTTPCLVEYEELPESEKEYDRNTAIETLKLIQKLGFKIVK
ncbi:MAG: Abi family protein [Clostridia bacterium]|nr:Abi family protein [Clostridia bacterium]